MDRDSATRLFSDYLEGTLSAAECQHLEAYLSGDPEAAAELEALRRTLSSLSTLRVEVPPAGFPHRVERRIRLRSRGRFFTDRMLTRLPFEWFSFVIIMLLLSLYLLLVLETRTAEPTPAPRNNSVEHRAPPSPSGEALGPSGETPAN